MNRRYQGAWLVFLGGTIGTLLRYLIALFFGVGDGIPFDVLFINLSGAFLLGLLVGVISGRGQPTKDGKRLRLLLGTGVLGGFTTYSTFAAGTADLLSADQILNALAYAVVTILMGAALSAGGLLVGHRIARVRVSASAPSSGE